MKLEPRHFAETEKIMARNVKGITYRPLMYTVAAAAVLLGIVSAAYALTTKRTPIEIPQPASHLETLAVTEQPADEEPAQEMVSIDSAVDVIQNEYETPITMKAILSGYCKCEECCGEYANGVTASGTDANNPGIAAPSGIPFGSRIDVPGYEGGPSDNGSWVMIDDRGGKIVGNKFDLRFKTHQEALDWGIQERTIRLYVKKFIR